MADSSTKVDRIKSEPSTKDESLKAEDPDIRSSSPKLATQTTIIDSEIVKAEESTTRIHTVTIDTSTSRSTDVGVQATPAAVCADLETPHKHQRGILPVTSDMRNSAAKSEQNRQDNRRSVTNTKEKTPMCQINELARFNKLAHKYVLVDEKGPAHRKEFHIRLDIGEETYYATSTSIKRAQHAAAEVALGATKLKRPAIRQPRVDPPLAVSPDKKKPAPVTPTVELNALAMKLGEHPEYVNLDPPYIAQHMTHLYYPGLQNYRYHHQYHTPRMPHNMYFNPLLPFHMGNRKAPPSTVLLKIGRREFRGQGATRQLARHNAANKALKVLSNIPLQQHAVSPKPEESSQPGEEISTTSVTEKDKEAANDVDGVSAASSFPIPSAAPPSPVPSSVDSDINSISKSEISLVHEMALQYGEPITFEVVHESGAPHMRTFITRAVCGDFVSEGEGNSKKKSKKTAAKLMLTQLEVVNQPTLTPKHKVKSVANKKKNRNLIKVQKANVEYGSGINPISRLIQIQQANKRKEPIYTLVMEHGLPRRREFIIQVECNDRTCQGKGPNKKLAKRNAAEEMLQTMGYSKPSPIPGRSVLKSSDHISPTHHNRHVTFLDSTQTSKLPGVLVRTDASTKSAGGQEMPPFNAELAASLAYELLKTGKSVVGETLLPAKEHPKQPLKLYKEQLEYLSFCMDFVIDFTDFPKGTNTNMCLTLVTLSTNPQQVFHGSASTKEESHNKAALQALTKLAESALDNSVEAAIPASSSKTEAVVEKSPIQEKSTIEEESPAIEKSPVKEVDTATSAAIHTTCNGDVGIKSTNDTEKDNSEKEQIVSVKTEVAEPAVQ